ncbi:2-Hydroxyacid oxidase 1-like isoform X1 [Daktulosphaira vitifoliae]|uniref:2-Hydroxyacid oxidase 1-like isoform X1 n=3 Tax=Daktulosphaira vitifoliae TaxID=58002 RepID=UPI0021AA70BE|nr:2-Hydroxyacid oxidase 1-like isoform X1 [Daktulosphaira vitifoliae]XP_050542878.1 2-Hydroxyacid oxidase 1-like isoform X1 [Daktulosphaira vitifoliae]XP_050542879.1 2-Hydroxyacid oxidase 1-like isoform X1 [Daktulosphaira vitifoliae]
MFGKLVSVKDYENYAANTLSKTVLDFYKSGACDEYTLSLNEQAFSRLRIIPNMLRNVCNRNYNLTILGNQVKIPIGISPCSMHKMAHEDGECASAQAAGKHGAIFILATLSTCSIEEVALAAPETIKWFQLYIYKDKEINKTLIKRAEKAGYKALVITVDVPVMGIRYKDEKNKFYLPSYLKPGNFTEEKYIIPKCDGSGLTNYVTSLFEEKLVWEDVKWLKSITNLPIVVKGILSVADAKIAADIGCHAVFVSNHGGRQLDTAPASIEALPSIVKEVGHRIDVYLDCGIRHGTDVFKALALGAKMVFLARPILWGLTYDGLKGAENILGIIINEFDNTMALTGCRTLDDIKKDMVVHESIYSKL